MDKHTHRDRQAGAEISPNQSGAPLTATAELRWGVARLLTDWEHSDDIYSEGAEKIVSWLLSHERLHEALTESDG